MAELDSTGLPVGLQFSRRVRDRYLMGSGKCLGRGGGPHYDYDHSVDHEHMSIMIILHGPLKGWQAG